MPARKFIALVAGILGIVAAFLPVAHGDGWITGFSLLRGNPWTLLPSMIAFVPSAVASSARTGRRSGAAAATNRGFEQYYIALHSLRFDVICRYARRCRLAVS